MANSKRRIKKLFLIKKPEMKAFLRKCLTEKELEQLRKFPDYNRIKGCILLKIRTRLINSKDEQENIVYMRRWIAKKLLREKQNKK